MDDDARAGDDQPDGDSDNRIAVGIALGLPIGVALSLMLDNWAMVGVGIALGAAVGVIPRGEKRPPGPD